MKKLIVFFTVLSLLLSACVLATPLVSEATATLFTTAQKLSVNRDSQTQTTILFTVLVIHFLVVVTSNRKENPFPGYSSWIMSKIPQILGFLLINPREQNPDWASIELQASGQKLSTILDSINAHIYIFGPNSRIIYVNQQMCEDLGFSRENIIGQYLSAFVINDKDFANIVQNNQHVLAGEIIRCEDNSNQIIVIITQ